MNNMSFAIPFSGIFQSAHGDNLIEEYQKMCEEKGVGLESGYRDKMLSNMDIIDLYAKEYVDEFENFIRGILDEELNLVVKRVVPIAYRSHQKIIVEAPIYDMWQVYGFYRSEGIDERGLRGEEFKNIEDWDEEAIKCLLISVMENNGNYRWEVSIADEMRKNGVCRRIVEKFINRRK